MPYHVELIQTDPLDSPTPGSGHYAGERQGFPTAVDALRVGIAHLGQPVPADAFSPCCDWQHPGTPITGVLVIFEDEQGNRDETVEVQARLRKGQ